MANNSDLRFAKRIATLTIPGGATSIARTLSFGTEQLAKVESFRAKATTDTATQIEIKDARGRVFYKDAADADYATAVVNRLFAFDDTATGLGFTASDSTGAAPSAGQIVKGGSPIVEGPLTITWSNGTAADTLRLEVMIDSGAPSSFRTRAKSLTIPAGATSVAGTFGFGGVRYGKVDSFRAAITSGTDTTTQIELKDAKGRIFYKDAANKDYTTAVNRAFGLDDTLTGLGFSVTDATGAALTAAGVARFESPIVEFPVTATWSGGTAAEVLRLELYVEV